MEKSDRVNMMKQKLSEQDTKKVVFVENKPCVDVKDYKIAELEEENEYLHGKVENLEEITNQICSILKTDLECIVHDVNDLEYGCAHMQDYAKILKSIKDQLEALEL